MAKNREVHRLEKTTKEETQAIINGLKHLSIFHRRRPNLESFFKYLFSDNNPLLSPSHTLSSDCSDVPIRQALQRGVRVIELDIWPNALKDDVDVLHGRMLTTPIALIKCLWSIKEYTFVASEYPIVITLEDHLAPDLQAKVAEMITQMFGDILFCLSPKRLKEFPSPKSLKKRIIISTKPPKEYLEAKDAKEKEDESQKRERL